MGKPTGTPQNEPATPPPEMGNLGYFFAVYPLPPPDVGYVLWPKHSPPPGTVTVPPGTDPIDPPWSGTTPPVQPPLGTWGPNDPRPSNPIPVYPGGSPVPPWWWDPAWGAGGRPPANYPSHPITLPGYPSWGPPPGGVTPPQPPYPSHPIYWPPGTSPPDWWNQAPHPSHPIFLPGMPGWPGTPPGGVTPPVPDDGKVTVLPVAVYCIMVPADQAPPFPGFKPPATSTPVAAPKK